MASPKSRKSNRASEVVEPDLTDTVPPPLDLAKFRILNIGTVCELTSLSRAQIYRLHEVGGSPRPVKLTASRIGWIEREILAWIESRIAGRGEPEQFKVPK